MKHRSYVSERIISLAVRAYDEAYETSQRDLHADEGDDGHVFGVMVWRRGVGRLGYFAEQLGIRVNRRNNHIEIQLPNGTLRPYPGGRNPIDDTARLPFRADSLAKGELVSENAEQLSLFGEFPRMRLVLLHVGDIENGLRELWIGAPFLDEKEEIVDWEFCECVYSKSTATQSEAPSYDSEFRRFPAFKDRKAADVDMGPRQDVEEVKDPKRKRESE